MPSQYVQQQQYNNIPQQIAQQSQDPNHPANPQNPKVRLPDSARPFTVEWVWDLHGLKS